MYSLLAIVAFVVGWLLVMRRATAHRRADFAQLSAYAQALMSHEAMDGDDRLLLEAALRGLDHLRFGTWTYLFIPFDPGRFRAGIQKIVADAWRKAYGEPPPFEQPSDVPWWRPWRSERPRSS